MRMQGHNLEEVLQDCAGGVRSCSDHHSKYAHDQVVINILSFLPLASLSLGLIRPTLGLESLLTSSNVFP